MVKIKIFDVGDVLSSYSTDVLSYWEDKRGADFAPAWQRAFRLEELGWHIIPSISVVDVLDGGKDFKYRFWGTRNVTLKGFEMTGKKLSEQKFPLAVENGMTQFNEIIQQRRPLAIVYLGTYKSLVSREHITYRFPLSDDGEKVDKIVTYQNLEIKPSNWKELYEDFRKLD